MAKSGKIVNSPLGETGVDIGGSAIGAVRLNPEMAYHTIPVLLKEVIDEGSEKAWAEIVSRIDYIYSGLGHAMEALDNDTGFSAEVKARVERGQKLFFKPNIVTPGTIDRMTHGPGNIGVCTPWEFVAALMRWFHDRLGISYHQMSIGEGGSVVSVTAGVETRLLGGNGVVTTQAVMEGKHGDVYGGWGFYFTRKYLADSHDPNHTDDPMSGYEESLSGVCLPSGQVKDKLLVYDINKIDDDRSNGREVPVAKGINFQAITLHKVLVGGNPNNEQDRKDWPGCVLVNVSKLKIHQVELITNVIKNLGVGLYPMEANGSTEPGKIRWLYASPDRPMPPLKTRVPHNRWVGESDEETGMPLRDKDGNYIINRTGGMEASMADIIEAVKEQDIMMLHVVDAIETTNVSHAQPGFTPVPEGFVFASTDPVAVDVLSARYLHSMLPVNEARKVQKEHHLPSEFIQRVPLPYSDGQNILTGEGYDSPISRYLAFQHCEERGLGQQQYHVVGRDEWHGGELASLQGRIGRVDAGVFSELVTGMMYWDIFKPLWDLQAMCFAYLEANDSLTGSNYRQTILEDLDENGDGVIDYSEKGRGVGIGFMTYGARLMVTDLSPQDMLRIRFLLGAVPIRFLSKEWNTDGHDFGQRFQAVGALLLAWRMSQIPGEKPDPFFPKMTWGNGKWPSLQYAIHRQLCTRIYGPMFPDRFDTMMSPYGHAFRYADLQWNGNKYTGNIMPAFGFGAAALGDDIIGKYHADVARGGNPLPFVLYVPPGLGSIENGPIPNVEETNDPNLVFTASFKGGEEVWQKLVLSEIP